MAQNPPTDGEIAAYYRFKLGDLNMTVISDAHMAFAAPLFGINQPAEDVIAFFERFLPLGEDHIVNGPILNLVMQDGDKTILFDTGFGPANGGKLVSTLAALGIAAESIDAVIMSHHHGDHIDGLSDTETLTFPNAMVYFPQPEYDFMRNVQQNGVGQANLKLQPALDTGQISFYNAGDEIISGVHAVAAFGHTPGHMNHIITSNGAQLLNISDTAINAYASLPNPTWNFQLDGDPAMAAATRQAILERAARERLQIMGYHFPFPGLGYIAAIDDGYQFVPVSF